MPSRRSQRGPQKQAKQPVVNKARSGTRTRASDVELQMECDDEALSPAQLKAMQLANEEHEKANNLIKAARAGNTLVPSSQPNTFTIVPPPAKSVPVTPTPEATPPVVASPPKSIVQPKGLPPPRPQQFMNKQKALQSPAPTPDVIVIGESPPSSSVTTVAKVTNAVSGQPTLAVVSSPGATPQQMYKFVSFAGSQPTNMVTNQWVLRPLLTVPPQQQPQPGLTTLQMPQGKVMPQQKSLLFNSPRPGIPQGEGDKQIRTCEWDKRDKAMDSYRAIAQDRNESVNAKQNSSKRGRDYHISSTAVSLKRNQKVVVIAEMFNEYMACQAYGLSKLMFCALKFLQNQSVKSLTRCKRRKQRLNMTGVKKLRTAGKLNKVKHMRRGHVLEWSLEKSGVEVGEVGTNEGNSDKLLNSDERLGLITENVALGNSNSECSERSLENADKGDDSEIEDERVCCMPSEKVFENRSNDASPCESLEAASVKETEEYKESEESGELVEDRGVFLDIFLDEQFNLFDELDGRDQVLVDSNRPSSPKVTEQCAGTCYRLPTLPEKYWKFDPLAAFSCDITKYTQEFGEHLNGPKDCFPKNLSVSGYFIEMAASKRIAVDYDTDELEHEFGHVNMHFNLLASCNGEGIESAVDFSASCIRKNKMFSNIGVRKHSEPFTFGIGLPELTHGPSILETVMVSENEYLNIPANSDKHHKLYDSDSDVKMCTVDMDNYECPGSFGDQINHNHTDDENTPNKSLEIDSDVFENDDDDDQGKEEENEKDNEDVGDNENVDKSSEAVTNVSIEKLVNENDANNASADDHVISSHFDNISRKTKVNIDSKIVEVVVARTERLPKSDEIDGDTNVRERLEKHICDGKTKLTEQEVLVCDDSGIRKWNFVERGKPRHEVLDLAASQNDHVTQKLKRDDVIGEKMCPFDENVKESPKNVQSVTPAPWYEKLPHCDVCLVVILCNHHGLSKMSKFLRIPKTQLFIWRRDIKKSNSCVDPKTLYQTYFKDKSLETKSQAGVIRLETVHPNLYKEAKELIEHFSERDEDGSVNEVSPVNNDLTKSVSRNTQLHKLGIEVADRSQLTNTGRDLCVKDNKSIVCNESIQLTSHKCPKQLTENSGNDSDKLYNESETVTLPLNCDISKSLPLPHLDLQQGSSDFTENGKTNVSHDSESDGALVIDYDSENGDLVQRKDKSKLGIAHCECLSQKTCILNESNKTHGPEEATIRLQADHLAEEHGYSVLQKKHASTKSDETESREREMEDDKCPEDVEWMPQCTGQYLTYPHKENFTLDGKVIPIVYKILSRKRVSKMWNYVKKNSIEIASRRYGIPVEYMQSIFSKCGLDCLSCEMPSESNVKDNLVPSPEKNVVVSSKGRFFSLSELIDATKLPDAESQGSVNDPSKDVPSSSSIENQNKQNRRREKSTYDSSKDKSSSSSVENQKEKKRRRRKSITQKAANIDAKAEVWKYRQHLVHLSYKLGVAKVSAEHGVKASTLLRWRKDMREKDNALEKLMKKDIPDSLKIKLVRLCKVNTVTKVSKLYNIATRTLRLWMERFHSKRLQSYELNEEDNVFLVERSERLSAWKNSMENFKKSCIESLSEDCIEKEQFKKGCSEIKIQEVMGNSNIFDPYMPPQDIGQCLPITNEMICIQPVLQDEVGFPEVQETLISIEPISSALLQRNQNIQNAPNTGIEGFTLLAPNEIKEEPIDEEFEALHDPSRIRNNQERNIQDSTKPVLNQENTSEKPSVSGKTSGGYYVSILNAGLGGESTGNNSTQSQGNTVPASMSSSQSFDVRETSQPGNSGETLGNPPGASSNSQQDLGHMDSNIHGPRKYYSLLSFDKNRKLEAKKGNETVPSADVSSALPPLKTIKSSQAAAKDVLSSSGGDISKPSAVDTPKTSVKEKLQSLLRDADRSSTSAAEKDTKPDSIDPTKSPSGDGGANKLGLIISQREIEVEHSIRETMRMLKSRNIIPSHISTIKPSRTIPSTLQNEKNDTNESGGERVSHLDENEKNESNDLRSEAEIKEKDAHKPENTESSETKKKSLSRIESLIQSVSNRVNIPSNGKVRQPSGSSIEKSSGNIFSEAHKSIDQLLGLGKDKNETEVNKKVPEDGHLKGKLDIEIDENDSKSAANEDNDTEEETNDDDEDDDDDDESGSEVSSKEDSDDDSDEESSSEDTDKESDNDTEACSIKDNSITESSIEMLDDAEEGVDENNVNLSEKLKSLLNADIFTAIENDDADGKNQAQDEEVDVISDFFQSPLKENRQSSDVSRKKEDIIPNKKVTEETTLSNDGKEGSSIKISPSKDSFLNIKYSLGIKQKLGKLASTCSIVTLSKKYHINSKTLSKWKALYKDIELETLDFNEEEEEEMRKLIEVKLRNRAGPNEYQIYIDNPEHQAIAGSSSKKESPLKVQPDTPKKIISGPTSDKPKVATLKSLLGRSIEKAIISNDQAINSSTDTCSSPEKSISSSPQKHRCNILRKSKPLLTSPTKAGSFVEEAEFIPKAPLYINAPDTMSDEAKMKLRERILSEKKLYISGAEGVFLESSREPSSLAEALHIKAKTVSSSPAFKTLSTQLLSKGMPENKGQGSGVFMPAAEKIAEKMTASKGGVFQSSSESASETVEHPKDSSKLGPWVSKDITVSKSSSEMQSHINDQKHIKDPKISIPTNSNVFLTYRRMSDGPLGKISSAVDAGTTAAPSKMQDSENIITEHSYNISPIKEKESSKNSGQPSIVRKINFNESQNQSIRKETDKHTSESQKKDETSKGTDDDYSIAFKWAVIKEAKKSGFANTAKWYNISLTDILQWHDSFLLDDKDEHFKAAVVRYAKQHGAVHTVQSLPVKMECVQQWLNESSGKNKKEGQTEKKSNADVTPSPKAADVAESQIAPPVQALQRTRMGPNAIKYVTSHTPLQGSGTIGPSASSSAISYKDDLPGDIGAMPRFVKQSGSSDGVEIASTWKQVQALINPQKPVERRYSQEYKNRVIRDCLERGQKVVAKELKIPYNEISRWRLEAKKAALTAKPKPKEKKKPVDHTKNVKNTETIEKSKEIFATEKAHASPANKPLKIKIKLSNTTPEVVKEKIHEDITGGKPQKAITSKNVTAVEVQKPNIKEESFEVEKVTKKKPFPEVVPKENMIGEPERKDDYVDEDTDMRMQVINFCFQYGVLKTQKKFGVTRQSIIDLMKEYDELNKFSVDAYNRTHGFKTKLISREKTSVEVTNAESPVMVSNLKDYIVTPEYIESVVDYAMKHGVTAATRKFKRKMVTVKHWISQSKKASNKIAEVQPGTSSQNPSQDGRVLKKNVEEFSKFRIKVAEYAKENGIIAAARKFKRKAAVVKSYMGYYAKTVRNSKHENRLRKETEASEKQGQVSAQGIPPESPIWEQDFVIKPSTGKSPLKLTLSPRRKSSVVNVSSDCEEDVNDFGSDEESDLEMSGAFEEVASWEIGLGEKQKEGKTETKLSGEIYISRTENTSSNIDPNTDLDRNKIVAADENEQVESIDCSSTYNMKESEENEELLISPRDVPNILEMCEEKTQADKDVRDFSKDKEGEKKESKEENENTFAKDLSSENVESQEETKHDQSQDETDTDVIEMQNVSGNEDKFDTVDVSNEVEPPADITEEQENVEKENIEIIPYEETIMYKVLTDEVDRFFTDSTPVSFGNKQTVQAAPKSEEESAADKESSFVKKPRRHADFEIMMNLEETCVFAPTRSSRVSAEKACETGSKEESPPEQTESKSDVDSDERALSSKQSHDEAKQSDPDKDEQSDDKKSERSLFDFFHLSEKSEELGKADSLPVLSTLPGISDSQEVKRESPVKNTQETKANDDKPNTRSRSRELKMDEKNLKSEAELKAVGGESNAGDGTSEKNESNSSLSLFDNLFKTLNIPPQSALDVKDSQNVKLVTDSATEAVKSEKAPEQGNKQSSGDPSDLLSKDRSERNLFDFMLPVQKPETATKENMPEKITITTPTDTSKEIKKAAVKMKPMFKFPKLSGPINFGSIAKLGIMKLKNEKERKEKVEPGSEKSESSSDMQATTSKNDTEDKDLNAIQQSKENESNVVKTFQGGNVKTESDSAKKERDNDKSAVVIETFEELRKRLAKERAALKLEKEKKVDQGPDCSQSFDETDGAGLKEDKVQYGNDSDEIDYEMYKEFAPQKIILILDISKKHGIEFASTSFGLPPSVIVNWVIEKDRKHRKVSTNTTLEEKLVAIKKHKEGGPIEESQQIDAWVEEVGWILDSKGVKEVLEKWQKVETVTGAGLDNTGKPVFKDSDKTKESGADKNAGKSKEKEDTIKEDKQCDQPILEDKLDKPEDESNKEQEVTENTSVQHTEKQAELTFSAETEKPDRETADVDIETSPVLNKTEGQIVKIPDILSFIQNANPRDYTIEQKAMIVLLQDKYGLKEVHHKTGINKGTLWTWKNQNKIVRQYLMEQTGGKREKKTAAKDKAKVSTGSVSGTGSTQPSPDNASSKSKSKISEKSVELRVQPKPNKSKEPSYHKGYRQISPTKIPDILQNARKIPTKDYTLEQRVAIVKLVDLYGVRTIHKQFCIPSGSIWNWQHNKAVIEKLKTDEKGDEAKLIRKSLDFDIENPEEPITIDTIFDRVLVAMETTNHLDFKADQKADAVCLINHFGLAYVCEKIPQVPRGTFWNWCHNKLLASLVEKKTELLKKYDSKHGDISCVRSDQVDKTRLTEQWLKSCQIPENPRKRRQEDEDSQGKGKRSKMDVEPDMDLEVSQLYSGHDRSFRSQQSNASSVSSVSDNSEFEEIMSDDEIVTLSVHSNSRKSENSLMCSQASKTTQKSGGEQSATAGASSGKASGEEAVVPVPEFEVIRYEEGKEGQMMVCYREVPRSDGGSTPSATLQKFQQETSKKKALKAKVGETDQSGNWVPLDEYYYGTKEGDPTYTEEKGEFRFKCWYCSKMLYNNVRAMQHIQGHIDSSKQQNIDLSDLTQCKHCYKQFDTPFEMQTHVEKVHLSNKVLMCRICEKDMNSPRDLTQHMRQNHNACEMPYVCQLCKFRSSMYSDVVDHFKKKHDSSTHLLCLYCLRTFDVKFVSQGWGQTQTYYGHLLKHQSKSSTKKCVICRLMFFNSQDVRNHRKHYHGTNKDVQGITGGMCSSQDPVFIKVPNSGVLQKKKGSQPKSLNAPSISKIQDYGDVRMPTAASTLFCVECKMAMSSTDHYKKHINCSMCRFATSCSVAYANHMMGFHSGQMSSLNLNIPWERPMAQPMFCQCGFTTKFGNKIANHLVSCSKWTCCSQKPDIPKLETSRSKADDDKSDGSFMGALGLVQKRSVTTRIRKSSTDTGEMPPVVEEAPKPKKRKVEQDDVKTIKNDDDDVIVIDDKPNEDVKVGGPVKVKSNSAAADNGAKDLEVKKADSAKNKTSDKKVEKKIDVPADSVKVTKDTDKVSKVQEKDLAMEEASASDTGNTVIEIKDEEEAVKEKIEETKSMEAESSEIVESKKAEDSDEKSNAESANDNNEVEAMDTEENEDGKVVAKKDDEKVEEPDEEVDTGAKSEEIAVESHAEESEVKEGKSSDSDVKGSAAKDEDVRKVEEDSKCSETLEKKVEEKSEAAEEEKTAEKEEDIGKKNEGESLKNEEEDKKPQDRGHESHGSSDHHDDRSSHHSSSTRDHSDERQREERSDRRDHRHGDRSHQRDEKSHDSRGERSSYHGRHGDRSHYRDERSGRSDNYYGNKYDNRDRSYHRGDHRGGDYHQDNRSGYGRQSQDYRGQQGGYRGQHDNRGGYHGNYDRNRDHRSNYGNRGGYNQGGRGGYRGGYY